MGSEETAPNSLENLNACQEERPEKQVLATASELDVSTVIQRDVRREMSSSSYRVQEMALVGVFTVAFLTYVNEMSRIWPTRKERYYSLV